MQQSNLQIQNVPESLQSKVEKDIEKRKADPVDIRSEFENIMSSTTPQQIQNKGVTQIGNTILTPNILNKAKTNMALKGKLFLDYKASQKPFIQDKSKPIVGLSGAD